jgi:hypothetical protein
LGRLHGPPFSAPHFSWGLGLDGLGAACPEFKKSQPQAVIISCAMGSKPGGPRPGIPTSGSTGLGLREPGPAIAERAKYSILSALKWEAALKVEEHTQGVGGIVTNLQALETVLRYFLAKLHNEVVEFSTQPNAD